MLINMPRTKGAKANPIAKLTKHFNIESQKSGLSKQELLAVKESYEDGDLAAIKKMGIDQELLDHIVGVFGFRNKESVLLECAKGFQVDIGLGDQGDIGKNVLIQNLAAIDYMLGNIGLIWNMVRSELQNLLLGKDHEPGQKYPGVQPLKFGIKSLTDLIRVTLELTARREEIIEKLPDLGAQSDFYSRINEIVKQIREGEVDIMDGIDKGFQREGEPTEGVEYNERKNATSKRMYEAAMEEKMKIAEREIGKRKGPGGVI